MSRLAIRNVKSTPLFPIGSVLERARTLLADNPVWEVITNTVTIGIPAGFSVAALDSSVLSSPDFTDESIPGRVTRSAVPFTLRFNPVEEASHRTLQNATNARTKVAWRVTIPHTEDPDTKNGASWSWDGFILSLDVPEISAEILDISGTIQVGSAVAYAQQAA